MRSSVLYAVSVVLVVIASVSCGRKGKVIPRAKMAEIYAEMFVMDENIESDPAVRREADTSLVYEAIFRKYGYTSDDYRSSMAYYIKDPDRYARILKESVLIMEARVKELKAEKSKLESISRSQAATDSFRPEKIYFLSGIANKERLTIDSLVLFIDSTGVGSYDFDVQKGYDTLYAGPRIIVPDDRILPDGQKDGKKHSRHDDGPETPSHRVQRLRPVQGDIDDGNRASLHKAAGDPRKVMDAVEEQKSKTL